MKITIAVGLALAIGLIASLSTAVGQTVPRKYQGIWIDQSGGQIKIDAGTIDFGSGLKGTITSIKPGAEGGEVMLVKYGNVGASEIELVWYLTKVNGREIMIAVNVESPTSIFVYQH